MQLLYPAVDYLEPRGAFQTQRLFCFYASGLCESLLNEGRNSSCTTITTTQTTTTARGDETVVGKTIEVEENIGSGHRMVEIESTGDHGKVGRAGPLARRLRRAPRGLEEEDI